MLRYTKNRIILKIELYRITLYIAYRIWKLVKDSVYLFVPFLGCWYAFFKDTVYPFVPFGLLVSRSYLHST